MTTEDRVSRIAKLEHELEQLRAQHRYIEALTPRQQVAEELHDSFCRSNHIDGCGWQYEDWACLGWTKNKYVGHATALLDALGDQPDRVAVARRVIAALRGVR